MLRLIFVLIDVSRMRFRNILFTHKNRIVTLNKSNKIKIKLNIYIYIQRYFEISDGTLYHSALTFYSTNYLWLSIVGRLI